MKYFPNAFNIEMTEIAVRGEGLSIVGLAEENIRVDVVDQDVK